MDSEILTYGIVEQTVVDNTIDLKVEELRLNGFTVLHNIFSSEAMREAGVALDGLLNRQTDEAGGKQNMQRANDDDLVRCPLAYSSFFLEFATCPIVVEIIRKVLGETFVLLMQNGIINRSENKQYQVRWHRDMNYQHWTSSKILAVNFLICLDKFYAEGGSTWVIPGSHLHGAFPSKEYVAKHAIPLEAPAGSVIIMDAMAYHRSGVNNTPNFIRRGLNHVVGVPILSQQIDIPRFLSTNSFDYSDDPFLARYLGYKWNPSPSACEWRKKHLVAKETQNN